MGEVRPHKILNKGQNVNKEILIFSKLRFVVKLYLMFLRHLQKNGSPASIFYSAMVLFSTERIDVYSIVYCIVYNIVYSTYAL